jgi:type VI secretion system protein ImpA
LAGRWSQWRTAQREALAANARKDVPAAKREAATNALAVLNEAARAASSERLRATQSALSAARPLIAKVDAWCTPRLGVESPSFSALTKTMDDAELVLTECLAMHPNAELPIPVLAGKASASEEGGQGASEPVAMPGVPQNRADAYRQLASIAEYLLRYEPHSPVPYLIQRAVEWGGKPLPVLLQELMSDNAAGPKIWSLLGLLPNDGGKGK